MIDPIASLHSPSGTLVSAYVNRRPSATRAEMVDLLKPLRDADRDRGAAKSVKADTERLLDLAGRIEADQSPAAAIFASDADGIFEFLALDQPVDPVASVGPRPYLRPLRAKAHPARVGVIVAEMGRARTYVASGNDVREIGDELVADIGKADFGGFGGYEEHRIRARADEVAAKMWREAGRRLLDEHSTEPLNLLVVGGHEETLEAVADQLHTYLKALPRARATVDPRTLTATELSAIVDREAEAHRRAGDEALLEELLADIDRGGQAVAGLARVLEACNANAVSRMVVSGPFTKPGVVCDGCRWLARSGTECGICGGPVFVVDDVVAEAMEATLEAGGAVNVVTVASRLDAEGVGAMLRFDVSAR